MTAIGDEARSLPIYQHEQAIIDAVRDNRVVVIEGPTGSGKTTQLPRILLRAGIGTPSTIGVTQPRRIAAVSVAWRIAEEEGVALGEEVGYAIRFDDRTSKTTAVKVMTDGILLQEARTDPLMSAYGVIIVDEAHERSLNIDFILGLLHAALEQRDDLRVIVSSATLLPETFQRFFADVSENVPLLSIDARTHPVEILHRPPASDHPADVAEATAQEIVRLHRKHPWTTGETPGAILAFLSGEAGIRNTADEIMRIAGRKSSLRVFPLYGRLTREEQERVFMRIEDGRKVVLATNIAETSITIPDVRFVVDTGLAKVPRVDTRTGVTTLREEGISKASADQRAGRAGRTAPGQAVRLYSRKDHANRKAFTDEEILRLDFTEVALRLIDNGVRDIERFPFPTPPPPGRVRAALAKLLAMRAIDDKRDLTDIGKRMVPFPLSPPLARMLVEAADRFPDIVEEVLLCCGFLSTRPVYLFPPGEEPEARAAQANLAHPLGDAVTAVMTYRGWERARDPEAYCRRNYIDAQGMAFIAKAHRQMTEIAQSHNIEIRSGGDLRGVNRCLAVGFPDRILQAAGRVYMLGDSDLRAAVHPSSSLHGSRHRFLVAAELVIAKRPYARNVSVLEPDWVAEANPDLAKTWRLRQPKRQRRQIADPESVPPTLTLGRAELPVTIHSGEPKVEIPVEAIADVLEGDPTKLSKRSLTWKTRIWTGRYRFMQGTPLGLVLRMLPFMPLPAKGATLRHVEIVGALLDPDRNLHTIERHLSRILEPALPDRGKRPGWLTFASNGGGGFWFDVLPDFGEAVDISLDGLEDLLDALPGEDELIGELQTHIEKLRDLLDEITDAHAAMKALAKRLRGRRS